MFSPPDYSAPQNFLKPRRGPWTIVLALHRQPILDAVREAVPFLKGRLLDVGCGNKPYASILRCSEHIGVDVATSPHDSARFDFTYDGKGLPFGDEDFDSVLCTEVLEHCPEPRALMREIRRVLRPGGHALITVPMVFHHHEEPYDYGRFTRYGIEALAAAAGLEMLWVRPRGGLYTVAVSLLYATAGYSISRRPFSDIIYWLLWPIAECALALDRRGQSARVISLGWQMLARRSFL